MSSCVVQVLQLRSAQSDESLQCLCAQVFQRLARAPAPARMDRPRGTWKHPAARQESLDGRKDLRRCVRCGVQSYIRKVGCVVFGCVAYYMNKPVEKRQSPWKRGRGAVYTPQEWYQKMSWVEEKAIRSSLQEPDSDSESEKGDAEAASASKPDTPVIDVDSSDEQSLDEIPDALAWLNIKIEPPAEKAAAEEAPAEETPAEKASAEEAPAEEAPGKAPAEEAEAMDADTEDVANEPQRKRIRRKRPQPVPVPKVRPMNILGAPEAPDADTNAAEAPTEETGNVQAEAPPSEETGTAQPAASSSTGDQGWTAEEWELSTEAVRASNKKGSKGRKRKLQLYERFRSLKGHRP